MFDKLHKIAKSLDESPSSFVITGSKLAQTLNIPDFRQAQVNGCSSCNNKCDSEGNKNHECHSQEENNYRIALSLLQKIKEVNPSPFHHLLAQLEQMKVIQGIITENVDSLHHLAGSQKVFELAGNLRQAICSKCHTPVAISTLIEKIKNQENPPQCTCGGILQANLNQLYSQDLLPVLKKSMQNCDLLLVVGSDLTDNIFKDIIPLAKSLCIINNEDTIFDSQAKILCHGSIEKLLPKFMEILAAQFCLD